MKNLYLLASYCVLFINTNYAMQTIEAQQEEDWVIMTKESVNNLLATSSQPIQKSKRVSSAQLRQMLLAKEEEIKQLIDERNSAQEIKEKLTKEINEIRQQVESLKQEKELIASDNANKAAEITKLSSAASIAQESKKKDTPRKTGILRFLACCLPTIDNSQPDVNLVTLEEKKQ